MNWDDPAARAALAERLGPADYNQAFEEHRRASVIETVNGHDIRPVQTRFGRLFAVDGTREAFTTLEAARERAMAG